MQHGWERCTRNFRCKTQERIILGRPGHIWEDNTKMDLREMDMRNGFNWFRIGSTLGSRKCGNERLGSINGGELLG
jgi:hypothetical protein